VTFYTQPPAIAFTKSRKKKGPLEYSRGKMKRNVQTIRKKTILPQASALLGQPGKGGCFVGRLSSNREGLCVRKLERGCQHPFLPTPRVLEFCFSSKGVKREIERKTAKRGFLRGFNTSGQQSLNKAGPGRSTTLREVQPVLLLKSWYKNKLRVKNCEKEKEGKSA